MGGAGKGDGGIPVPARPDQGQLSNRFPAGAGIRRDSDSFVETKRRPAYRGLRDDDRGYVEGNQILFTELGFRYYVESRRPTLQNVDLIDIVSISPRDDFFTPVSWKVRTGLRQRLGEDGADHLLYDLASGAGLAWKIPFAVLV